MVSFSLEILRWKKLKLSTPVQLGHCRYSEDLKNPNNTSRIMCEIFSLLELIASDHCSDMKYRGYLSLTCLLDGVITDPDLAVSLVAVCLPPKRMFLSASHT